MQDPSNGSDAPQISRFTQPGDGAVNSWILEAGEALVLIDCQRSLSAGHEVSKLLASRAKPLNAILLTHPHPDHFGGLSAVLGAFPETPVYASAATTDIMRQGANGLIAATKAALGDDAPDEQPLPTRAAEDGQRLLLGGMRVDVEDIGCGEAQAMTMFYAPDANALFTGDLVGNAVTPFLLEGRTREWLAQLTLVEERYAGLNPRLFPGHGQAGSTALFQAQRAQIAWVRDAIKTRGSRHLSDTDVDSIATAFHQRFPDHPPVAAIPFLMHENVKAVAEELRAARPFPEVL